MRPTVVVLYGPPASGKDTITAALARHDSRYEPFRRLKIGSGKADGYRLRTHDELEVLRSKGMVLYENERYGNSYVVDEPHLIEMLQAGRVPVIHLGQLAGVRAVAKYPATWIPVLLWCSRETTETRAKARGSAEVDAPPRRVGRNPRRPPKRRPLGFRLYDRHRPLVARGGGQGDPLTRGPRESAKTTRSGARRPMTASLDIVVPALALRQPNGDIDVAATRRYAERAAATWIDYFIISGSTTRGQDLSAEQRADLLDLWLDVADRRRLLACCWTPDDIKHATSRAIAPMATMRQIDGGASTLAFLRQLPKGSYIYSHPMFGGAVFDAELAKMARNSDALPAGGKIAKISTPDVAALSQTTGPTFKLWDGSSRRIQASVDAGAAGVVATPLCSFDTELPSKEPALVQAAVDPVQAVLDALPDRPSRTAELLRRAASV